MNDNERTPITNLCLNITDNCNFNCRYCFVHQEPNNMSLQVAENACEWAIANSADGKPSIFFFGGEPTIRWDDIIVPIVNKYPDIRYNITTNGYLLDEEKINFMLEHKFDILLSMDGAEPTQSFNRNKNSFEKLDNIIPYLLEKFPDTNFRGTIIPETCGYTFENILYAQNKGFHTCYFTINIFENWSPKAREILEEEIKKYTLGFINSFVNETPIIDLLPFTRMIGLITKNEMGILDNKVNRYKCGLGNGYGAVDYKGDIYTCQEIVTHRENNHKFKIGNIYDGIDNQQIENLVGEIVNDIPLINNKEECGDCPLSFCCKKNSCQVNNFICNNHCLIQSENQCWWDRMLYNYAALSISILQDLPKFQKYMENIILERG